MNPIIAALTQEQWNAVGEMVQEQRRDARDAALEEAAIEMECIGEARAAIRIRAMKSKPATGEGRLFSWSRQKAQHAHLGDEDRRPDEDEP